MPTNQYLVLINANSTYSSFSESLSVIRGDFNGGAVFQSWGQRGVDLPIHTHQLAEGGSATPFFPPSYLASLSSSRVGGNHLVSREGSRRGRREGVKDRRGLGTANYPNHKTIPDVAITIPIYPLESEDGLVISFVVGEWEWRQGR